MMEHDANGLLDGLERIAGLAMAKDTVQSMLDVVVLLAKQLLPKADGVGLTLRDDGRWKTTAHTDEFVTDVDARQYEANDGPCLDAARDDKICRVDDLATDERWPEFADAAAKAGVHSVLSAPMSAGSIVVGAINLYAFVPKAFGPEAEDVAKVLARHATLALANRTALGDGQKLAEQLHDALTSRQVIGEAKGMLMERRKLTSDEAFDVLREMSQAQNRKLRTIAEEIVSRAERGAGE